MEPNKGQKREIYKKKMPVAIYARQYAMPT
jgi:hypothetical protein